MGTAKRLAARPNGMGNIGVDDGRPNDALEGIDTIVNSAEPATRIQREPTIRPGARP